MLELLTAQPLTERVASLERSLLSRDAIGLADVAGLDDLSWQTAASAMQVRVALGRINDLIHASVICAAIPRVLVSGSGSRCGRPWRPVTIHPARLTSRRPTGSQSSRSPCGRDETRCANKCLCRTW